MIEELKAIVRKEFQKHGADHDWYHIERVYAMSAYLQQHEGGNGQVIACAALLHDISDHKLNGGKLNDNGRVAAMILEQLNCDKDTIDRVVAIVDAVSFKGANIPDVASSVELAIVRDADRLDAMGALGIARAFHFGGSRNRPFFEPDVAPEAHDSFEAYHNSKTHTLNHFHEKLLLLQDRLHTKTAQRIGIERHELMKQFVDSFYKEWFFMANGESGHID